MKTKTKIAQHIVMALMAAWGFMSLLILAGEETPGHPVSETHFFTVKVCALASLAICCLAVRYLNRHKCLPESKEVKDLGRNDRED